MKINGNLTFNADASGVIQNAYIEQFAVNPVTNLHAGRIIYRTDVEAYFYYDGSTWQQFAAGTSTVSSFKTTLVGLTPSVATTGAISLDGTLAVSSGGTGDTSFTTNGVPYGAGSGPLAVTAAGTAGQVLTAGVGGVPAFAAVNLALPGTAVTGILPLANGGTGSNLTDVPGAVVYGGATTMAFSSVGSTGNFLVSGGTGAPTWLVNSTPIDTDGAGVVDMVVGSSFNVFGTANEITTTAVTSPAGVTISVPSTFIAPGSVEVTTSLTIDGLTYESAQDAITAHAGGGQASAFQLTKSYNVVTVTATAGDSVKLPVSAAGLEVTVVNRGATSLDVYPTGSDQIDAAGASNPVVVPSDGTITLQSVNAGQWYSIDPVVVTGGTGIAIVYGNGQVVVSNTGVTSFSAGTTGFTPSSPTTGAVVLAGTLNVANGGTGDTSFTLDGVLYGNGTSGLGVTAAGTTGQFLVGNTGSAPTWSTATSVAVTSFQTSLSGLTPSSATTGAVTLAGTLGVASGGTGDTTLTLNGVLFGNGTSAVGQTAAGSQFNVLVVNGSGVPVFGQVNLAQSAAVSGLLGLSNGGTNANLTAVAGAPVYSTASALALGTAGTAGQAYISGGTAVPTWQNVSATLTTNQILEGNGSGAFTANGATFVGSGSFSGVTLSGVVTNPTDAATKAYVDAAVANLNVHASALVFADATNAFILSNSSYTNGTTDLNGGTGIGATLTDTSTGSVLVVDGVTVPLGGRVVVNTFANTGYPPNPAAGPAIKNGIYALTTVGVASTTPWVLTRATDYNDHIIDQVIVGDFVFIAEGTVYANTGWTETDVGSASLGTNGAIKIGTDNIYFTQFSGAGTFTAGAGLTLTGGVFAVKPDNVTIYINGSSAVAVDSSAVAGQVLRSTGTTGTTATWGAIDLSNSNAVANTLPVANGGTGDVTFTTNGVVYGNSTSPLGVTAAGTTGQVLVGSTGAPPSWSTLTGIAVTSFQTSLSGLTPSSATTGVVTLSGTLGVPSGGTGDTTLTQNGVLFGNGTAAVGQTSAGTDGTYLAGHTGSAPTFVTLASSAVTSISGTANQIDASAATGAVTLSLDPVLIAPGSVTVTTLLYESTAPSITATGTTQGTAFALTKQFNVITTTTGGANGVALPTAAAGLEIEIVNLGTSSLNVYPATGAAIDGAATNAPIVVPSFGTWTGEASSSTQWYSVDPVIVNGAGIGVAYGNGQTVITNSGVLSWSGDSTGLTPSTGTTGNVTLGGTLNLASGGTNASLTASAGSVVYSTASAMAFSAVGTSGYYLTSGGAGAPTWTNPATSVVQSFQTSLSGLTPSTPTTGAVTLAGTLGSTSGGTGVNNSTGAVGTALVASTTGNFTATPIQFNYDSTLHGGTAEYFAVTHNLNQKYVTVQVYTQDTQYAIVSAASAGPSFTVATDLTTVFTPGTYFIVAGSSTTGNNQAFTVVSSTFGGVNTVITVTGSVISQGASGEVVVGPAQIIPQGIFLVDANNVVVTLNATLNVFIVVTGVHGVALA